MADFVAVIRKAVDGLANNTPETRAKVYEKARSAVVRQLENMNPRPPEELLRRQVVKLDAAIAEVEGEYAEALPPLEDEDDYTHDDYVAQEETTSGQQVYAPEPAHVEEQSAVEEPPVEEEEEPAVYAAAPVPVHEPEPEVEAVEEPEPVEHPVYQYAPEPEPESEPEPAYYEPQAVEPVYTEEPRYEEAVEDEPVKHEQVESEQVESEQVREEETAHYEEVTHAQEPRWVDDGAPAAEDVWREPADDAAYPDDVRVEPEQPVFQPLQTARSYPEVVEPVFVSPVVDDEPDVAPEPEVVSAPAYGAVEPDNRHSFEDESDPFAARADYRDDIFAAPAVEQPRKYSAQDEDFSSYFEDATADLPPVGQPAAAAAVASAAAAAADTNKPSVKEVPLDFASAPADTTKEPANKERTPWDDLEELIGYDGIGTDAKVGGKVGSYEASASGIAADGVPPASYMVKKKPRRNYASYVLALLGVLLLAGGGYALWLNRDAMNDMVSGLTQSAQPETATTTEQPAQGGTADTTTTPPATTEQTAPVIPQSDDGSVQGTKFTQRLLPDGTERDEGPAPGANGQPVTAEGQSVYEQNEAAPAQTPDAAGATTPAAPGAAAGTPPAAAGAPLAAGAERMFLYEEVLGQTVPTAIEGSVAWTLQHEQAEDGKQLATVQGQMSIPARGLSALITFKRNLDSSLPASHLVEIVFSVSPGFEGGAIDSVQRIAMKQTEQDRGNALIAVPAKITDDFHMIALNDFPDAMKTNLELLATRDWIDIPVSYRNGRRALLTMQKGPEGRAAFDAALKDWASVAPAAGQ